EGRQGASLHDFDAKFAADARILRPSGTRRQQQVRGRIIQDGLSRDHVVAIHVDDRAEFEEILHQVEGEAVVVVDHHHASIAAARDGQESLAVWMQPRQLQVESSRHAHPSPLVSATGDTTRGLPSARRAMAKARSTALAFRLHSSSSASGTESKTKPAPACTRSSSSPTTTVRMQMAKSAPPSKPM